WIGHIGITICRITSCLITNGYTNVAYPTTALDELSVTYYDDYDFNSDGTADYTSNNSPTARSRSKLTGQFTKVLNLIPPVFEKSISFYDYKGRIIEIKGNNYEGETESETFVYNFSGQLLQQERIHHYTFAPAGGGIGISTELVRKIRNEYDPAGRLKNAFLQVNSQPEIWTSSLSYNELGQLLKRKLHNQSLASGTIPVQKSMQTLDYKYNTRGWLTAINDLENVKDNGDYWGMELHYTDGYALLDADAQFAGNISWMAWRSNHDQGTRIYGYSYDPLNRLTKSKYATNTGSAITEIDQYTVDDLSYDDNGNMKTMKVHGAISYNDQAKIYTYGITDHLNYTYNGNQLKTVSDAGSLVTWDNSPDFKDTPGENDYGYDVNGNMVNDANKAIAISYNHLNLPSLITKSADQLKVTYNANGSKVKEETTENLQTSVIGYFGDIIHEYGEPQRILFTDGYLLKDTTAEWVPYYFIKDHLGNIRVVFKGQDLNWTKSNLTFELNADEEGNEFPKFKNVSSVRNTELALQGNCSGKLFNTEGPFTEIPVKCGDTIEVSVYYYYPAINPQKQSPPIDEGNKPFQPSFSFEMRPLPHRTIPADEGNPVSDPTYGLQLNIVGLFELLSRKRNNSGNALRTDSTIETPEAYLELSLRDTAGEEINQWRVPADSANNWSRITDSIGIHVPDSNQQYKLRVSLHNESEQDIWFDTLYLKLGVQVNPVIQVNHYYPYGNLIADLCWQQENSDTNDYLYNGKELHRSLNLNWLDYGARWYDPQVGRWWVVDPMAENFKSTSTYNFTFNNPQNFIDQNGKWPDPVIGIQVGMLFYYLSTKINNTVNGMVKVGLHEVKSNSSMPLSKASQENVVGTKVVSDISKLADPIVKNSEVVVGAEGNLSLPKDMGELKVGVEGNTSGTKVYLNGKTKNGPDLSIQMGTYTSSAGESKSYLSANGEKVLGDEPEKKEWEQSIKVGVGEGMYIKLNANPTEILNTYRGQDFENQMQNIQQSYNPFIK
ncbi:MAG TPA: RHS repeat-associated core domain-containing protein, partial [Chitinophagales bacterium]|nr:RHS repeat-associated core domain-containing protein [Chitinophagales bacterium]